MNWDRIEGNWKQFTGTAKAKWGKLTEDRKSTRLNSSHRL